MPDSPTKALYYPHSTLANEEILKTSLLLWDKVEVIVPFQFFSQGPTDPLVAKAHELICVHRIPEDADKIAVHQQIEELVKLPGGVEFFSSSDDTIGGYELYPHKLSNQTWNLLKSAGLVEQNGTQGFLASEGCFQDYVASHKLGLLLMLYLAEACGKANRRLVTDRNAAYAAMHRSIAANFQHVSSSVPDEHQRLVTESLEICNVNTLSLESLVKLREAEEKSTSSDYRDWRRNYLKLIDDFALELVSAKGDLEKKDIREEQARKMRSMHESLESALYGENIKAMKSVLVSVVAAGGAAAAAPLWGPIAVAGAAISLAHTALENKQKRREAMGKSAMAWLIEATK